MAKFNYLVITLLLSISTFFFTESEITSVHNTSPQPTVQASTSSNTKGLIVDSHVDFTVDASQEDNITFFKQQGLLNAVCKEQQESYLVYQKTSQLIDVGLTTRQIIFPFHWFT